MLCKQDSAALTNYMALVTAHLDEPLTSQPEHQLEASLIDAITDYLDLQSETNIAVTEQGLLLLMIPQELTFILDRIIARCLRDYGTELPFGLQLNDGKQVPELELTSVEPTEKTVQKIIDWAEQSTPTVNVDDKPFFDRLLLLLWSWLRQKSMEKAAEDFHQKATQRDDDGPSI